MQAQVDETVHNALHGLDHDEDRLAEALAEQGSSREQFEADARENAEKAIKTQLLVDAIADKLEVQVGQDDRPSGWCCSRGSTASSRSSCCSSFRRTTSCRRCTPTCAAAKLLAAVVRGATVADTAGNTVDTDEFFGPRTGRG